MATQTASRSLHHRRYRLFLMATGMMSLSLSGCAEIEVGAEIFKNLPRASNVPPAQPDSERSARQDSIEPSMRADPQAFYATGLASWDGSQTLQGVWIAHPKAEIARRVRLTNDATGTQVDAAMFRRDPNLSGPQLIVSSEAANLLGLTPGQGTPITVEGLAYRTDVEATPIIASAVDQPDPTAGGATAIRPVEAEIAPAASAIPGPPNSPDLVPDSTSISAPPGTLQMESSAEDAARPEPDQTAAGAGGVKTTEPEPHLAASVPTSQPNARREATVPDRSGDIVDGRYFVQAGVFSKSENATRLVEVLRAADLPAQDLPITLGDRQFKRVLVGPYRTIAERDAALKTVRRIGPADATPARG